MLEGLLHHTIPTSPRANNAVQRVESLQSGSVIFDGTEDTKNITVTAVTTTRAWLIISARVASGTGDDEPRNVMFCGDLTSTTNIQITRAGANTAATVEWQLIEFTVSSGVSVQRGKTTCTSTSQAQAITAVTLANSFVWVTANSDQTTLNSDDYFSAYFNSTTELLFDRNNAGGNIDVCWQVVSCPDFSVQHLGPTNLNNAGPDTDVTIPATTGNVVVVHSGGEWNGSSALPDDNLSMVYLQSSTNVRYTVFDAGGAGQMDSHRAQVVKDNYATASVQAITNSSAGSGNASSAETITAVDTSKTAALNCGSVWNYFNPVDAIGRNPEEDNVTSELTNTTTITLQRDTSGNDWMYTTYAWEFE